jgi:bacteriorhodopsin
MAWRRSVFLWALLAFSGTLAQDPIKHGRRPTLAPVDITTHIDDINLMDLVYLQKEAGVNLLGMVVLHTTFLIELIFVVLFTVWTCRMEDAKRPMYYFGIVSCLVAALCYIMMATGSSVLVLRKTGVDNSWEPAQPLYNDPTVVGQERYERYISRPIYVIFWGRYLLGVLLVPALTWCLTRLLQCEPSKRVLLVALGLLATVCWFLASLVLSASRYVLWLLGVLYAIIMVLVLRRLKFHAVARGPHFGLVYNYLRIFMSVYLLGSSLLWALAEGTRTVPSSFACVLYATFDLSLTAGCFSALLQNKEVAGRIASDEHELSDMQATEAPADRPSREMPTAQESAAELED